eukprot:6466084-Amphidinium_carterae.1
MEQLTSMEEYEFKGPYIEYQIKKIFRGWAWWYQSLGEVMPDAEAINFTKTEQETSVGETNFDELKTIDLVTGASVEIKRPFPETPGTREKRTLVVSQISEQAFDDSLGIVLDPRETVLQEDSTSVLQVEPSIANQQGSWVEESADRTREDDFAHGWNLPDPTNLSGVLEEKWFIE